MADSKITDLTELTEIDGAEELVLNDGGNDRKCTLDTVNEFVSLNPGMKPNRYYSTHQFSDSFTTSATSANTMVYVPFHIGRKTTVTRIGIAVTTLSAGNAVLGIYKPNEDDIGYPGAPLLDAGTVSTSTTGEKEITISQSLDAGLYWGMVHFEATPIVRADSVTDNVGMFLGTGAVNSSYGTYLVESQTYDGTALTSVGSSSITVQQSTTLIKVWVRVV